MNAIQTESKTDAKVDAKAWGGVLKSAIENRDERRYREELMRLLVTREGSLFVDALMKKTTALPVMRRTFRALGPALGVSSPNDLVGWLAADARSPRAVKDGARDVVSMALPYFRFARSWAEAVGKESSYAAAMAMMLFEPVLALCEQPLAHAASVPAQASAVTAPSFARITQRA
jgi:hypothetical protein